MRILIILALLCITACGPQYDQMSAVKAVAAERVANGSMTQAEADLMVARERTKIVQSRAVYGPNPVVQALDEQQRQLSRPVQPVYQPRPMVICNTFPGQIQCY